MRTSERHLDRAAPPVPAGVISAARLVGTVCITCLACAADAGFGDNDENTVGPVGAGGGGAISAVNGSRANVGGSTGAQQGSAGGDSAGGGSAGGAVPGGGSVGEQPVSSAGARGASDGGLDGAPGPARPAHILPVIWLEVPGQTPDSLPRDPAASEWAKVAGRVRIIEEHDGTHQSLKNAPVSLDSAAGVSRHGVSSAGFPQKSFALELRDETQRERSVPILGLPAEADFALIACWTDKTCMRNALAYTVGARLGRWAPRFRFVEVYFNGAYQGLFQLVELIRQGRTRADVPKPAPDAASGDLSGGYIIRRESGGKGSPSTKPLRDWLSPQKDPDGYQTIYTYHVPNEAKITEAQKSYIRDHMAAFEAVMYGPNKYDPTSGYRAWIDVKSWADFLLIAELANQIDGFLKSLYITKLPDAGGARGKLLLAPLWDYNLAFGNADYLDGWKTDLWHYKIEFAAGGECSSWVPKGPPLCDGACCQAMNTCKQRCWNSPWTPYWLRPAWADPTFRNDLACRWKELRSPGGALDFALITGWLEAWRQQLEPLAVPRHFGRWPALRGYVWPNPYKVDPSSAPVAGATVQQFFESEVTWLGRWLERRLRWLDANLSAACSAPN